jgi:hypothetical protein
MQNLERQAQQMDAQAGAPAGWIVIAETAKAGKKPRRIAATYSRRLWLELAPPGGRAGARVTVTGTVRKQFFIFYFFATQFSAALPAPPASSIMAS